MPARSKLLYLTPLGVQTALILTFYNIFKVEYAGVTGLILNIFAEALVILLILLLKKGDESYNAHGLLITSLIGLAFSDIILYAGFYYKSLVLIVLSGAVSAPFIVMYFKTVDYYTVFLGEDHEWSFLFMNIIGGLAVVVLGFFSITPLGVIVIVNAARFIVLLFLLTTPGVLVQIKEYREYSLHPIAFIGLLIFMFGENTFSRIRTVYATEVFGMSVMTRYIGASFIVLGVVGYYLLRKNRVGWRAVLGASWLIILYTLFIAFGYHDLVAVFTPAVTFTVFRAYELVVLPHAEDSFVQVLNYLSTLPVIMFLGFANTTSIAYWSFVIMIIGAVITSGWYYMVERRR